MHNRRVYLRDRALVPRQAEPRAVFAGHQTFCVETEESENLVLRFADLERPREIKQFEERERAPFLTALHVPQSVHDVGALKAVAFQAAMKGRLFVNEVDSICDHLPVYLGGTPDNRRIAC